MVRKIILFQSASICWTIISPTTKNPLLMHRANVGPTKASTLSAGSMLGQCQHANNDVLPVQNQAWAQRLLAIWALIYL